MGHGTTLGSGQSSRAGGRPPRCCRASRICVSQVWAVTCLCPVTGAGELAGPAGRPGTLLRLHHHHRALEAGEVPYFPLSPQDAQPASAPFSPWVDQGSRASWKWPPGLRRLPFKACEAFGHGPKRPLTGFVVFSGRLRDQGLVGLGVPGAGKWQSGYSGCRPKPSP